jgi:ankyrin repeat protein
MGSTCSCGSIDEIAFLKDDVAYLKKENDHLKEKIITNDMEKFYMCIIDNNVERFNYYVHICNNTRDLRDVASFTRDDFTLLEIACRYATEDFVRILLKKLSAYGSIENNIFKENNHIFYEAAFNSVKILQVLISFCEEHKVDIKKQINKKNEQGLSSLMIAARQGMLENVKILVSNGAKVNDTRFNNGTSDAVWFANNNNFKEIEQFLKEKKEEINNN